MHSALPKVLHPLAGKPIVGHVIDAVQTLDRRARSAWSTATAASRVREALHRPGLAFALQDPPRGTGDAVRAALPSLPQDGVTMVVLGDVPLVRADELARLAEVGAPWPRRPPDRPGARPARVRAHRARRAGQMRAIVEERDATPEQRAIDEINTGVMRRPDGPARALGRRLRDDNAQGSSTSPTRSAWPSPRASPVEALLAADERDVRGINDRAQLAECERILQRRRAEALLRAGTWIADPDRFDLRGTLTLRAGRAHRRRLRVRGRRRARRRRQCRRVLRAAQHDDRRGHGDPARSRTSRTPRSARIAASGRSRTSAPGRSSPTRCTSATSSRSRRARSATVPRPTTSPTSATPTLGDHVNFGAGAIIANYDGANKHRTVIGDNAHIGINCVLVAPVTIGAGATIGGGSTHRAGRPARRADVRAPAAGDEARLEAARRTTRKKD